MSIVKNTPHYLKHSGSFFTTIINKTIESIQDPAALGIYLYLAPSLMTGKYPKPTSKTGLRKEPTLFVQEWQN